MRPSIIVTTAGVHGPHTSPHTSLPWTLRIQFCCAVRPTDTQCPSTPAAGGFAEPAGVAGSGWGFNSKFSTTRVNEIDAGVALESDSGRDDSVIRLRASEASTRSRLEARRM